jgi:hypothetical protein
MAGSPGQLQIISCPNSWPSLATGRPIICAIIACGFLVPPSMRISPTSRLDAFCLTGRRERPGDQHACAVPVRVRPIDELALRLRHALTNTLTKIPEVKSAHIRATVVGPLVTTWRRPATLLRLYRRGHATLMMANTCQSEIAAISHCRLWQR